MVARTNHKMDEFYRRKAVQSDAAMPLQQAEEEKRQSHEHLMLQVVEETKAEAFMAAKVDDPVLRREQMALDLRNSKRQELLSKRRYPA